MTAQAAPWRSAKAVLAALTLCAVLMALTVSCVVGPRSQAITQQIRGLEAAMVDATPEEAALIREEIAALYLKYPDAVEGDVEEIRWEEVLHTVLTIAGSALLGGGGAYRAVMRARDATRREDMAAVLAEAQSGAGT